MSEKIYALLFRLYPSHFRAAYEKEGLQLFRDRAHNERGFVAKLCLWMDLLADFALSIPSIYRYGEPVPIGAVAQQGSDWVPSFQVLENESIPLGALLWGSVVALVALWGITILLSRAGERRLYQEMHWSTPGSHGRANGGGEVEEMGGGHRPLPARPDDTAKASAFRVSGNEKFDASERQRVIDAVRQNLTKHYFDARVAEKMAAALLAHQKSGDYDLITDGTAFADLLTTQMKDVSHDAHLEVVYSRDVLPDMSAGPPPGVLERYRSALEQQNCTFERVEVLRHNIGYIKLNSFPDPSICQATATGAMIRLNQADAIIFDLRDNGGGNPAMVSLIAAYLFDHPEYMYSPREAPTEQSWTRSAVPGNKLADKPVYVLTSASTWSGAEQFSYDLKMLKRAILVGETTRGSAHAGVFHRLDDHFGMGIPEEKAINPFGKADWEGTGVDPDVKVKAADALDTALQLAESTQH